MAGLLLIFRANPEHLQTTQETAQETTQETTQERVLVHLRAQPSLTRKELASRLGLSDSGVKYHLEKLKAAGAIRHVGATKAGHWEVLK
jgi:ATP-dependent DNA helicase RecG